MLLLTATQPCFLGSVGHSPGSSALVPRGGAQGAGSQRSGLESRGQNPLPSSPVFHRLFAGFCPCIHRVPAASHVGWSPLPEVSYVPDSWFPLVESSKNGVSPSKALNLSPSLLHSLTAARENVLFPRAQEVSLGPLRRSRLSPMSGPSSITSALSSLPRRWPIDRLGD